VVPLGSVVIVGASAAGTHALRALRSAGYAGGVTLIGDEAELPYDRPPLSKQALRDPWQPEKLQLCPAEGYRQMAVNLMLGRRAIELDRQAREVVLDDGARVPFERLLIATGCAAKTLPMFAHAENVYTLRTVGDALKLRRLFETKARLAIIGAGFVGTEVAATAVLAGMSVALLDSGTHPLEVRLGPMVGARIGELHQRNGVDLRMRAGVESPLWSASGRHVCAIRLRDGSALECDAVIVAVGASPNIEWLRSSGLHIGNGVECDEFCRAAEGIYAAGDVAEWFHPGFERRMRVEHRTNAAEQASVAAVNLLGGNTSYSPVPFFWSDQYNVKLQVHGTASLASDVRELHGQADQDSFVLGYFENERLTGVLSWNAFRQAREWIPRIKAHWTV